MDLGLTQRTLAERLGVREETIQLWEAGRVQPLPRHHGGIFRLLEISPEPHNGALPKRLRSTRLLLGLTQEQMAERLGLNEWSLCRWESGRRSPSRWMAERVTRLLDAMEAGDGQASDRAGLSFFDLTRWRRRPPSELLAIEPSTLGERIRQARLARGMSQLAVASLFGITHATLYRWESGTAPVPQRRKAAIRLFLRLRSDQRRRRD